MFTLTDWVLALDTLVTIGVFCGGVYFTSLHAEIQERHQTQTLPIRGCCIQCTLQIYGPIVRATLQAIGPYLARFFGLQRTLTNLEDFIFLLESIPQWWKPAAQQANQEQQENIEQEQQGPPEQQEIAEQHPLFPERRRLELERQRLELERQRQQLENLAPLEPGIVIEGRVGSTYVSLTGPPVFFYRQHTNGDLMFYIRKKELRYPKEMQSSGAFAKRLIDFTNKSVYDSLVYAKHRARDVRKKLKMTPIERFWESIHEINPPTGEQKDCPLCYDQFSRPRSEGLCRNEKAVYDKTHVAVSMKCEKGHIFGASCLWEWFRACTDDSKNVSCLLCRTPLDSLYDQETIHGRWSHHMAQINQLAIQRAELQKSEHHWSWVETFNRINLDHWFEITQEEWEHQLKDVLLGLRSFNNMTECRQTIEKAYLLLRGLRKIGLRSRKPALIKVMVKRDLDAYLSDRYYVQQIRDLGEGKDLLGALESLSTLIIDVVHDLKGEVFRPSLTRRFTKESSIFWGNERIKKQLVQRNPISQKKWIHDVKATKDALEATMKWKEWEQSSTTTDNNNLHAPAPGPETLLPNGTGFHTRSAEAYLQKRLSLLLGYVSPDQHLQDGPMTVDQIQVVAKNMLDFAKAESPAEENKGWWRCP